MKQIIIWLSEMLKTPLDYCLWALSWAFAGMLITLAVIVL